MNMKLFVLTLFFPLLGMAQWDGKTASIKSNGFGCTSLQYTEEMHNLIMAGNTRVQNLYFHDGKCLKFSTSTSVTVLRDASDFTDPSQAQVLWESTPYPVRLWVPMALMSCCQSLEAPLATQVANPPPGDIVRSAEEMLNQLGFDAGEADGIVRGNTVAAVLDYQAAHGLPITGDIDEGLIKHLQGQIAARTQPQSN